MSKFETWPATGSLFRNTYKKEGENSPDYRGKIATPDGTEYNLAGWVNKTKKGDSYLSLKVTVITGDESPEVDDEKVLPFL